MANNLRVDDADAWKTAMDMTIPAVVTIHSAFPYPFDTDTNRCAQATGFVVDKDRGYILTNRHVVGEGPYSGRAVFLKGAAESFVEIVYVEPEHDFALVRYNVENVSGLPVKEIKLRPKIVEEGLEIRVIGNDAGQTMSILPGVISRVDCNPPDYGHNYKDACKCRQPKKANIVY